MHIVKLDSTWHGHDGLSCHYRRSPLALLSSPHLHPLAAVPQLHRTARSGGSPGALAYICGDTSWLAEDTNLTGERQCLTRCSCLWLAKLLLFTLPQPPLWNRTYIEHHMCYKAGTEHIQKATWNALYVLRSTSPEIYRRSARHASLPRSRPRRWCSRVGGQSRHCGPVWLASRIKVTLGPTCARYLRG